MFLLKLPLINENMTKATIVEWLVSEGDVVEFQQDLVECVADKGDFRLYTEEAGQVLKIFTTEGDIYVGMRVALIGEPGDEIPDVAAINEEIRKKALGPELVVNTIKAAPKKLRATPGAKRLLAANGLTIDDVAGKIDKRLITEKDVKNVL
jgi:pyruvate/2-oxoglutarate dehydrogenase complex dihydrolipoamide acyltransferase (E2) component